MTRKKTRKPQNTPARQALNMLCLGYDAGWVARWLWHSSRVEAGLSPHD